LKGKPIQDHPQARTTAVPISAGGEQPSKQPARLDNIFHDIPGAVMVMDREGRIRNMNQAARALLGKADKDLLLGDWPRLLSLYLQDGKTPFPAENLPPMRALRGVKDVPPVQMLLRSNADGQEHKISMSAGAIIARDGVMDGITVLIQDVTSRPEAEIGRSRRTRGLHRLSNLLAESADDINRIANSVAAVTSEILGDLSAVTLLEPQTTRLGLVAFHDADPAITARFKDLLQGAIDLDTDGSGSLEGQCAGRHIRCRIAAARLHHRASRDPLERAFGVKASRRQERKPCPILEC
jgi:PAS domain S-box-containing protein